jgi:hypothetical protein
MALMSEMPHTRKHHRHPVLVSRGNHLFILDRAAWLNDRFSACLGRLIDSVTKRVED